MRSPQHEAASSRSIAMGGRIQAEAAAHEIVHLTTGYTSSPVIEEGLAVYVAEALAPHARTCSPKLGNLWMAGLLCFASRARSSRSNVCSKRSPSIGTLMARLRIPRRGRPMSRPAPLYGGSWSREDGRAFWRFYQTRSALVALGAPVAEIEREWLQHLARQELTPKPCRDVLAQNVLRFRFWCPARRPLGLCHATLSCPTTLRDPDHSSRGCSAPSSWPHFP